MVADIVVKNGKLVSPEGIIAAGVAITGEKIVAVASDDSLPQAKRTIDAKGNYILPGLIDPHIHFGGYHPFEQDSRTETASAACGGVTTIGNFLGGALRTPRGSFYERMDEHIATYEKNAFTDIFFHSTVGSEVNIEEMPRLAKDYGVIGYKFLMGYKGETARRMKMTDIDDGILYLGFKQIAALGPPARAMFHAENIDIINRLAAGLKHREDLPALTEARPGFVEALDVEKAVSIARVTRTPLYMVHLSSTQGLEAAARAKQEGVDLIVETCPCYLTLTKDSPLGPFGLVYPPLKDEESIERLWGAINKGVVQCMGSDHSSLSKSMKTGIWTGLPGLVYIEHSLPIMLSEGVNKGRITLEKLVEVWCANNARATGIYPRKGTIRVGSDADLVIVDLNKKVKITAADIHGFSDYCTYEGWEVKGYPVLTMLRGKVVMEDGKLAVQPGVGRYIKRAL